MKNIFCIFILGFLVGCANTGALSVGKDMYSVSTRVPFSGSAGAKGKALEEANEHCASINKKVLLKSVTSHECALKGGCGESEVVFMCLDENDPRYMNQSSESKVENTQEVTESSVPVPSSTGKTIPNKIKIMIFGGVNNEVYLGCLNCNEYDSESIFNKYGNYGSDYSLTSIHNQYGNFGSKYSNESVCSPYASKAPVIVDSNGGFYGHLSVNKYHNQLTDNMQLLDYLSVICK